MGKAFFFQHVDSSRKRWAGGFHGALSAPLVLAPNFSQRRASRTSWPFPAGARRRFVARPPSAQQLTATVSVDPSFVENVRRGLGRYDRARPGAAQAHPTGTPCS